MKSACVGVLSIIEVL